MSVRMALILTSSLLLAGSLAFSGVRQARADGAGMPADAVTGERQDVTALLQSLNGRLLANPSATLTLDAWCVERGLAVAGTKVVAEPVEGEEKEADETVRSLLAASADEPVAHRRVRLRCGSLVLSEADNWYVPAMLTTEMNRTLRTTNVSFGRVVAPLGFTRETLDADILWAGEGDRPHHVIRHRARLLLPDGRPFSALVENYTAAVLGPE